MLSVEALAAKTTHSTQGTLARYQSALCPFDKRLSEISSPLQRQSRPGYLAGACSTKASG